MLKFFALLALIWIFFKAVGMIFRSLLGGPDDNRGTRYQNTSSRRQPHKEGDVNVDHDPTGSNKGYQGGEYVDYEEVD